PGGVRCPSARLRASRISLRRLDGFDSAEPNGRIRVEGLAEGRVRDSERRPYARKSYLLRAGSDRHRAGRGAAWIWRRRLDRDGRGSPSHLGGCCRTDHRGRVRPHPANVEGRLQTKSCAGAQVVLGLDNPSPARLRLRLSPPLASLRAGSATRSARFGNASSLLGKAIAATKWRWKAGSIAVSIFSMRLTTLSISARAARLRSAMRAPVPAALPALATLARSQSGMRPSVIAWRGSMWLPKAPASAIR